MAQTNPFIEKAKRNPFIELAKTGKANSRRLMMGHLRDLQDMLTRYEADPDQTRPGKAKVEARIAECKEILRGM